MEAKKKFFDDQRNTLVSAMDGCNKTALLLPKHDCEQVAQRLALIGHQDVFIGKELYTNVSEAFELTGFVPYFIQRRIKGMEMSGIWEWWSKLITSKDLSLKNGRDASLVSSHKSPTMGGNILLIFVVCSHGLLLAVICFLVEAHKQFWQATKHYRFMLLLAVHFITDVDRVMRENSPTYKFTSNIKLIVSQSKKYHKRINLHIKFS